MNTLEIETIKNKIITTDEFWRVEIYPTSIIKNRLTANKAKILILNNAVSQRGWPFPFFDGKSFSVDREGNFAFGYDSSLSLEVFKVFKSGQFVFMQRIRELGTFGGEIEKFKNKILLIPNLYKIMEFTIFAHNLSVSYNNPVNFKIIFKCSKDRKVYSDYPYNLIPVYSIQSEQLFIERTISPADSTENISKSICKEFFEYFSDLNIADSILNTEWENLLIRI